METTSGNPLVVEVSVKAPLDAVWKLWTTPEDIRQWNNASADWHTPRAVIDLRTGGKFLYRMEARDGSFGFDFEGVYDLVKPGEYIGYTIEDGRKVEITFKDNGAETTVVETFEAESQNTVELQRAGWQAILDNFKTYVESRS